MRAEIEAAMAAIVEEFTEPAGNARRIRPALWPDPATKDEHIRGDLSELRGLRTEFRGRIVSRKFIDCVSEVMHRRMATDPRIIVMGEDIHRLRGGTNGASPLPRDPAEIRARASRLPPVEFRDVPASFILRASWDVTYSFWSGWMARSFPGYRTHRLWSPWREYGGWALRGLKRPLRRRASIALTRALRAGPPYWLLPLQLEGDYQLRAHSP
ncbi:MAG: hypothetical protein ACK45B_16035, partial [Limisphaerales bacterium]